MRIRQGLVGVGAVFAVLGVLVQACATEVANDPEDAGTTEPVDANTADRTATPVKDAGKDTSTPTPTDASKPDTSVRDAAVDSGPLDAGDRPGDPFDPTVPGTGQACPAGVNVNDVISRRCGKCGTQNALCETGRVVGVYGACSGEKTNADACLPNATKTQACGLCGRQLAQCDTTCSYVAGACTGEVAGGCVAGSVKYLATCTNPNEFQKQVCSATCTNGAPQPCAPRGADVTITVAQTAAGVVTQAVTPDATKIPAIASPFCNTTLDTVSTIYNYVVLSNPGAQAVNVTVKNKSLLMDTAITAYAGSTIPGNRLACLDHVGLNKFTVAIPAGGSQIIYVGALDPADSGNIPLEIVTNFVGAQTPVPDYTLAISQTMGGIATQAMTFDEAKFGSYFSSPNAPADYTGAHACPPTKTGQEYPQLYVRLTNSGAAARTVNLITTEPDLDTFMAVFADTPTFLTRRACVGSYNDDCTVTDFNACLNGVTVPANGSVVVYVGQITEDGFYDTNELSVTTTN